MENQVIAIQSVPQEIHDFCALPNGIKKALKAKADGLMNRSFPHTNIKIEDGIIYFSCLNYRIQKRPNNVYYLAREARSSKGFTVNKRGTMQIWWNKGFDIFPDALIKEILKVMNLTWILNSPTLLPFITKGNFGKILTGKIKNPTELAISIIKIHKLDIAPAMFIKLINYMSPITRGYFTYKVLIISLLAKSTNANAFVEKLDLYHKKAEQDYYKSKGHFTSKLGVEKIGSDEWKMTGHSKTFTSPSYNASNEYRPFGDFFTEPGKVTPIDSIVSLLKDIIEQLDLLGHKMDLLWSYNRLQQEHAKWSKEIMAYEIEEMDDERAKPYILAQFFEKFEDEFTTIIDTKKKAFVEGELMSHCFYTNYWDRVKSGKYLSYHTTYGGVEGTLSIDTRYYWDPTKPLTLEKFRANFAEQWKEGDTSVVRVFTISQFYGKRNKQLDKDIHEYYQNKIDRINYAFMKELAEKGMIEFTHEPEPEELFEW